MELLAHGDLIHHSKNIQKFFFLWKERKYLYFVSFVVFGNNILLHLYVDMTEANRTLTSGEYFYADL